LIPDSLYLISFFLAPRTSISSGTLEKSIMMLIGHLYEGLSTVP
jgi:hypothetical protein